MKFHSQLKFLLRFLICVLAWIYFLSAQAWLNREHSLNIDVMNTRSRVACKCTYSIILFPAILLSRPINSKIRSEIYELLISSFVRFKLPVIPNTRRRLNLWFLNSVSNKLKEQIISISFWKANYFNNIIT